MNKTISDLPSAEGDLVAAEIPVSTSAGSAKINVGSMADLIWEQMYVKARKVIVTCSHCGSANAITNSNCISCGAPLGKDIEEHLK